MISKSICSTYVFSFERAVQVPHVSREFYESTHLHSDSRHTVRVSGPTLPADKCVTKGVVPNPASEVTRSNKNMLATIAAGISMASHLFQVSGCC